MRKAIYINCWTDPWLKVASEIRDKHGIEPGFWIGYQEEQKEKEVRALFPNAIYQSDLDAWCGRFPAEIENHYSEEYLDADFINSNSKYELIALKMLDRVDPTQHTFSFPERQRHVRNLFRKWMYCLEYVKPEFVVTPMVPHRVYDYTLYVVCKYLNVPFVFFNHTPFDGRCIVMREYYSIGEMFKEDYLANERVCVDDLQIEDDVQNAFEKNKKDYRVARPIYMIKNEEVDRKWNSTMKIFMHVARRFVLVRRNLFGKNGRLRNWVWGPYYKQNEKTPMEASYNTLPAYLSHQISGLRYIKKLKKHYERLTVKPNYSEKYVILFLHYQPEATTCPIGNIFVDQELCVDMLLKHLPEDYYVYIKEHPSQFYANSEGQLGRMKETYNDLANKPRVKMMSTREVSFDLIEHCSALATVSGTVGWEGIVRGKPVIAFGMTWYENYDKGCLRVSDNASAERIKSFIDNYIYDEYAMQAYLASVSKNTIKAYFYKAVHKDRQLVTETECIENLAAAIMAQLAI